MSAADIHTSIALQRIGCNYGSLPFDVINAYNKLLEKSEILSTTEDRKRQIAAVQKKISNLPYVQSFLANKISIDEDTKYIGNYKEGDMVWIKCGASYGYWPGLVTSVTTDSEFDVNFFAATVEDSALEILLAPAPISSAITEVDYFRTTIVQKGKNTAITRVECDSVTASRLLPYIEGYSLAMSKASTHAESIVSSQLLTALKVSLAYLRNVAIHTLDLPQDKVLITALLDTANITGRQSVYVTRSTAVINSLYEHINRFPSWVKPDLVELVKQQKAARKRQEEEEEARAKKEQEMQARLRARMEKAEEAKRIREEMREQKRLEKEAEKAEALARANRRIPLASMVSFLKDCYSSRALSWRSENDVYLYSRGSSGSGSDSGSSASSGDGASSTSLRGKRKAVTVAVGSDVDVCSKKLAVSDAAAATSSALSSSLSSGSSFNTFTTGGSVRDNTRSKSNSNSSLLEEFRQVLRDVLIASTASAAASDADDLKSYKALVSVFELLQMRSEQYSQFGVSMEELAVLGINSHAPLPVLKLLLACCRYMSSNSMVWYASGTGQSLLHSAVKHGSVELTEYILRQEQGLTDGSDDDADPDAAVDANTKGSVAASTPTKRQKQVQAQLAATVAGVATARSKRFASSALVLSKDSDRNTALHMASQYNRYNLMEKLIRAGAKIETKNSLGLTPLHIACQYGHVHCVSVLLKQGADISARDSGGFTALMWCAGRDVVIAGTGSGSGSFSSSTSGSSLSGTSGVGSSGSSSFLSTSVVAIGGAGGGAAGGAGGGGAGSGYVPDSLADNEVCHINTGGVACARKLIQAGANIGALDRGRYSALYWSTYYGLPLMGKEILLETDRRQAALTYGDAYLDSMSDSDSSSEGSASASASDSSDEDTKSDYGSRRNVATGGSRSGGKSSNKNHQSKLGKQSIKFESFSSTSTSAAVASGWHDCSTKVFSQYVCDMSFGLEPYPIILDLRPDIEDNNNSDSNENATTSSSNSSNSSSSGICVNPHAGITVTNPTSESNTSNTSNSRNHSRVVLCAADLIRREYLTERQRYKYDQLIKRQLNSSLNIKRKHRPQAHKTALKSVLSSASTVTTADSSDVDELLGILDGTPVVKKETKAAAAKTMAASASALTKSQSSRAGAAAGTGTGTGAGMMSSFYDGLYGGVSTYDEDDIDISVHSNQKEEDPEDPEGSESGESEDTNSKGDGDGDGTSSEYGEAVHRRSSRYSSNHPLHRGEEEEEALCMPCVNITPSPYMRSLMAVNSPKIPRFVYSMEVVNAKTHHTNSTSVSTTSIVASSSSGDLTGTGGHGNSHSSAPSMNCGGCKCVGDCRYVPNCPCVARNGQKIPYSTDNLFDFRQPKLFECGPLCACAAYAYRTKRPETTTTTTGAVVVGGSAGGGSSGVGTGNNPNGRNGYTAHDSMSKIKRKKRLPAFSDIAPCSLRLTQRGVSGPMVVCQMAGKGLGVICLRDYPKGSFICTYTGEEVTEKTLKRQEDSKLKRLRRQASSSSGSSNSSNSSNSTTSSNRSSKNNANKATASMGKVNGGSHTAGSHSSRRHDNENDIEDSSSDSAVDDSRENAFVNYALQVTEGGNDINIDSEYLGNVARFFNHSCEPNMRPIKVLKAGFGGGSSSGGGGATHGSENSTCAGTNTGCSKMNIPAAPTMAFFASRNILAGEELCWKYVCGASSVKKSIGFSCHCGSPNCVSLY